MQITAFNYVNDEATTAGSLARLATLIAKAREDARKNGQLCLLFDNGDTFQGGPMADFLASHSEDCGTHPMVAAMNLLDYDAGGLGNHDCDFGLNYLNHCLSGHKMPVVCSNMRSAALEAVQDHLILERQIKCTDGQDVTLRIGVLSSLPDKTAAWNRHHLSGRATLDRPVPVLQEKAAQLKDAGADLIVVLAHMGLSTFNEGEEAQNLIADVANVEGVDIVIGGHTHLRFPGPDHENVVGADTKKGLVNGTPTVMPGPSGADLGQIDLCLQRQDKSHQWHVTSASVELLPATASTPEDKRLSSASQKAHAATRKYLHQEAAKIRKPVHSYFSLAENSLVTTLMACAKKATIAHAVAGSPLADLPLLAATSAKLSGGFDGPDNFISLKSGKIQFRHIAGLNPYANQVWAVRATGRRLIEWLERSAIIFNRLKPDAPDQLLTDQRVPGFHYDAIYGLDYDIDLREPAMFDPAGCKIATESRRIKNISWQGKPLDPDQHFLVATTDHRAGGGGVYRPFPLEDIVVQGTAPLRQALIDYLNSSECETDMNSGPWRFVPNMNRSAILLTSPHCIEHLDDIAHLRPEPCGITDEGFLRLRLHL